MPSPRFRNYAQLPDADKVQKARTALDALVGEPEIVKAMTAHKYTKGSEKMAEGEALYEAVVGAMGTQAGEVGDRVVATATQVDELAEAHDLYTPVAGTARAIYRDERPMRVALGLTGTHDQSYAGRVKRMRDFVTEASKPEHLARFAADSDVDMEELDALTAALDEAERRMSAQDRKASRSQHATEGREGALRALVTWMLKMHGFARVALRGKPQLLEMLGVPRR